MQCGINTQKESTHLLTSQNVKCLSATTPGVRKRSSRNYSCFESRKNRARINAQYQGITKMSSYLLLGSKTKISLQWLLKIRVEQSCCLPLGLIHKGWGDNPIQEQPHTGAGRQKVSVNAPPLQFTEFLILIRNSSVN